MAATIEQSDCLEWLARQPTDSVDLVFGSPPYENCRTYGIGFDLDGQDWVDWMVKVWRECDRVCKGLVAFVVEGKTKSFRWSATPALLMADLHRAGIKLRKPPIFHRVGIPGSGGPDWLRNNYEFIVCSSRGKLPWSDNTAMGHPPKWAPGGEMSHRLSDGARVNQWGHSYDTGIIGGGRGDKVTCRKGQRPSHELVNGFGLTGEVTTHGTHKATRKKAMGFGGRVIRTRAGKGRIELKEGESESDVAMRNGENLATGKKRRATRGSKNGDTVAEDGYDPPARANPGNVIHCLVGGGVMGNKLCHGNEAPFPEALAEFFVRSFCPPGGTVCDCFSGSGTTAAVSVRFGINFAGCDIRKSQVDIGLRRLKGESRVLFEL